MTLDDISRVYNINLGDNTFVNSKSYRIAQVWDLSTIYAVELENNSRLSLSIYFTPNEYSIIHFENWMYLNKSYIYLLTLLNSKSVQNGVHQYICVYKVETGRDNENKSITRTEIDTLSNVLKKLAVNHNEIS